MSRFDEIEDNWQWAEGPWNDGAESRIVYGQAIDQGPTVDTIGQLAHDSWIAGWTDADMQLSSENETLRNWSVKTSYDADNCRYDSIVGNEGEHIATVHSHALAQYIIAAVAAYAGTGVIPPIFERRARR
jgi:hypothetical protein